MRYNPLLRICCVRMMRSPAVAAFRNARLVGLMPLEQHSIIWIW